MRWSINTNKSPHKRFNTSFVRSFCFAYKIKPLGTPSGTFTLRVNRKQYRTYYFYDKNELQFIGLIGGRVLTWGRRVPEAADKIAVYRVKVFLFELF